MGSCARLLWDEVCEPALGSGAAVAFCVTNRLACVRSKRDSGNNLPVNPLPRPEALLESNVAHVVFHEAGVAVQTMVITRMGMNAHANRPTAAEVLFVRPLSLHGPHLQPLRPWSALLQHRLFGSSKNLRPARCRQALSGQPKGPSRPCPTPETMEGVRKKSDASG